MGSAWSCLLGPAQLLRPSPASQHCSLGHCSAPWLVVFVHKSCSLCLATFSYPKINTLGFYFAFFFIFHPGHWPTFEGLKGGRRLFADLGGGGLLRMMLVLVMWTEVPVIGDNISGSLQTRSSLGRREHRASTSSLIPAMDPGRRDGHVRSGPFFLLILTSLVR